MPAVSHAGRWTVGHATIPVPLALCHSLQLNPVHGHVKFNVLVSGQDTKAVFRQML